MRVSLVAVTHRSAGVLPAAVESFRHQARAAGAEPEVVVVDHSEDAAEAERLAAVSPDELLLRSNRGYAAGINAGIAAAGGEVLLCANPDLRFLPGSVAALLAALERWELAGPRFELAGFVFPPADEQTPRETIGRALARRSRRGWERRLLREARRWRRLWRATEPLAVPQLSGALIAVRRETARRLGPWDEGYFLYFEETDWLRRAAKLGMTAAVVPAAKVEHAWGHAGDRAADRVAGDRYQTSRERFLARHHPWLGRAADRVAARLAPSAPPAAARRPPEVAGAGELCWLVSPSAWLLPSAGLAAAERPDESYRRFAAAAPAAAALTAAALDLDRGAVHGPWRVAE